MSRTEAFLADSGVGPGSELRPVSGGDVCEAFHVVSPDGEWFLKRLGSNGPPGLFAAEAEGLEALGGEGLLRVPAAIAWDADHLLLEYLPLVRRGGAEDERLGRALAALHAVDRGRFGWSANNWIGRMPQSNPPLMDWSDFYCDARLLPQARRLGGEILDLANRLADRRDRLFAGHRPHAALVHGDLWAGNAAALQDGTPVVFDPAVHHADRECDLAMAALFGGYSPRFYAAYEECLPCPPGAERRQRYYQLYHVLNHANLFGGGYVDQSRRLLETLIASV
ncbi:MAG: fructosamine kinase family protein [Pseudomonadota bacterium]